MFEVRKVIRRVSGGYPAEPSTGHNPGGSYPTLEEAKKRLRQIKFFKHRQREAPRPLIVQVCRTLEPEHAFCVAVCDLGKIIVAHRQRV
jgi:hypothetical protein